MTKEYIGIDPGLSGGFVVVSGDRIRCKMVMPTLSFTTEEGKTKTEIDREGVLSFLKIFPPHTHVVIEQQEAFRSQNITSTCTTCRNYGMLLMALTAVRFYVTEVPSSVWQKHYGIVSVKKGEGETTKQQAYKIAQAKYPHVDFRKSGRSQKPHDGMVDAALIADYCQSRFAPLCGAVIGVQYIPRRDEAPLEVKPLVVQPGGTESGTKLERRMF
jgi:Holliday junction resolvasome RuvABC endonuclease subunit